MGVGGGSFFVCVRSPKELKTVHICERNAASHTMPIDEEACRKLTLFLESWCCDAGRGGKNVAFVGSVGFYSTFNRRERLNEAQPTRVFFASSPLSPPPSSLLAKNPIWRSNATVVTNNSSWCRPCDVRDSQPGLAKNNCSSLRLDIIAKMRIFILMTCSIARKPPPLRPPP